MLRAFIPLLIQAATTGIEESIGEKSFVEESDGKELCNRANSEIEEANANYAEREENIKYLKYNFYPKFGLISIRGFLHKGPVPQQWQWGVV